MEDCEWPEAYNYITCDGKTKPSHFPRTFVDAIPIESGKTRFLDIGCGSGIIGIYCLIEKKAAFVTFNDKSPKWVLIASANVEEKIEKEKILKSQVAFIENQYADIPMDIIAKHTLLGFNPPQLPTKHVDYLIKTGDDPSTRTFRDGGEDGLDKAREFFQWYAGLAKPKPDAVIHLSSFLRRSAIEQALRKHKFASRLHAESQPVSLRHFFQKDADDYSKDTVQRADRSLEKNINGKWTKKLLTYLLSQR